jgi:4-diphosphocytidyl-2-C-methyl-D-erythritol kinase
MIVYPNAKINLGLNVLRKRNDGYHDIDSVFYPVQWKDILEVLPKEGQSHVAATYSGLDIPGDQKDNLCFKAYDLLAKDFQLPGIQMHLHKLIPMGAGLGGGSADGAYMLRLLNKLFTLEISDEKLEHYATQLGSDCPFFIKNQVCHVSGRGEKMVPISLDLSNYFILLINPGLHIGTREAYAGITPSDRFASPSEIVRNPIETWKSELKNDFETSAFILFPEIQKIKESLYEQGALYASMTGSGSTVYGIFEKDPSEIIKHYSEKKFEVFISK